jgi:membrane protein required for colicin V production
MHVLDWIILGSLTLSMLLGAWRGLVYEVLSVMGWVSAFILAQWFAPDMAQLLPMRGAGEAVRYAAGFVLVFVLSVFAAALLARLAKTLFSLVGLQPVDRILGAIFGLVRGAVLVLAAPATRHRAGGRSAHKNRPAHAPPWPQMAGQTPPTCCSTGHGVRQPGQ